MSYELLVEVTRNGTVESRHFGAAVVSDAKGTVLESWGDIDGLVFPRSAIKPMLAIHVVESGASDHYNLSDKELSLACASHQGEPMHQEQVTAWLNRLGLTKDHLACGPEFPEDKETAHQMLASGQDCCQIHHNCSGKHAGFLTTAQHLGLPLKNYHQVEHPLQQMSLDIFSDLAEVNVRDYPMGVDGCGFPAPSLPLVRLGRAMARFANPVDLKRHRGMAISRLKEAVTREPLFMAGLGTLVSELNAITKGGVLAKTGAEGVFVAALQERGLGIALKISDGNVRARSVALLAILDHLGVLSDVEKTRLQDHISPELYNSRGENVGQIMPASSWLPASHS
jgi:L-asparaginase II